MNNTNQFEQLYGPLAANSSYHIDDKIEYKNAGDIEAGTIIWVVAGNEETETPIMYMVSPDTTSFPIPIYANEILRKI